MSGSAADGEGPAAPSRVAATPVLRRLQRVAAAYGVGLAAAFAFSGDGRRGLVLTGGAVVSIVALRSLEGVVRRLGATAEGPPPGLGWRYPLRLLLLVVLVSTLVSVGRDPLALVLGVSAVPAALLVEAARQLAALGREPEAAAARAAGPPEQPGRVGEAGPDRGKESESEP